jgi:hypothetical protein
MMSLISETQMGKMRKEMKAIATRRYTWKIVSDKYNLLIKEALNTAKKPSVYAEVNKLDHKILEQYNLGHLKNSALFYEKR